ncbi:MAG: 2,3-diaminopropionate biosynthesis protein SbnB, partial [Chloroflexota bacterium]
MSSIRTTLPDHRILYLNQSDIIRVGGAHSQLYVDAIQSVLALHAERAFVQPLKPYLRWRGNEGHIADRIIAMPAYIGGTTPAAGLKWVGSKHDNPTEYGLSRASALIVLNDVNTHFPIAIMEGSLISGMRTAAVTAVAARYLALPDMHHVSCIGCGPIGTMQLTTLIEQFPHITTISLFDINTDAAQGLADRLITQFPHVTCKIAVSAEAAVRAGEVVLTCTVTSQPYIPYQWLRSGTFLSNVSIMDVQKEVFLHVDKVIVDDWDQSNREKKIIHQLVEEGLFSREQLHAELGEIVVGARPGRESADEIILLNPMGMAVED